MHTAGLEVDLAHVARAVLAGALEQPSVADHDEALGERRDVVRVGVDDLDLEVANAARGGVDGPPVSPMNRP